MDQCHALSTPGPEDGPGPQCSRQDFSLWEFLLRTGDFARTILALVEIPQTEKVFQLRRISRIFRGAIPDAVTSLRPSKTLRDQSPFDPKCILQANDWVRQVVCGCKHLRELELDATAVGDDGLSLLSQCTRLNRISLGRCLAVTQAGVMTLVAQCGSGLRHLTLPYTQQLADELLQAVGSNAPELREFISGNHSQFTNKGLDALGKGCRHLETLHITDCYVTNDGIASVAALCKSLRVLTLAYMDGISDEGLSAVLGHIPNLEELDLTFCTILDAGVKELATRAKNLRKLSLADCLVSDEGVKELVAGATQLQSLRLDQQEDSDIFITDDSLQSIATHCKHLRLLSVTNNPRITDAGVIAVTKACPMLEVLDVSGTTAVTDHAIEEMMRQLPQEQCKRLSLLSHRSSITDVMRQTWNTHRASRPITSFFAPVAAAR